MLGGLDNVVGRIVAGDRGDGGTAAALAVAAAAVVVRLLLLLRHSGQRLVGVAAAADAHRQAAVERSAQLQRGTVLCIVQVANEGRVQAAVVGGLAHLGGQRRRHVIVLGGRRVGGHCDKVF